MPRDLEPAWLTPFFDCVAEVLRHEGGFVNHPKDPGGATNMGITRATLSLWRGELASVTDVRNLTQAEARQIYFALYWNPLNADRLPPGLNLEVFDFGVNAGVRRSAMMLQLLLAVKEPGLAIDGVIGPMTLAAVAQRPLDVLIEAFHGARMDHYHSLAGWGTFGKGWTARSYATLERARAMAGYRVRY